MNIFKKDLPFYLRINSLYLFLINILYEEHIARRSPEAKCTIQVKL